jgi:sugar phosphate isomerase/epimerase
MISFGWCRGINDAELLRELGFQYVECGLTSLQLEKPELTKAELPKYTDSPLPVKAFNGFFPRELKIVGPEADADRIRNYLARAAEALHRIGASIAVLGSGASRQVPDGWELERGEEQMLQTLQWAADEFEGTGVTIAIEPLNRKETNLIHRVEEAVTYAQQVNAGPIRVLADFYHMMEEQEPLTVLTEYKDWIVHIHVADTGRKAPGTGHYPYDEFADQLRNAGYKGMISAECGVDRLREEMSESLAFLKAKFQ